MSGPFGSLAIPIVAGHTRDHTEWPATIGTHGIAPPPYDGFAFIEVPDGGD